RSRPSDAADGARRAAACDRAPAPGHVTAVEVAATAAGAIGFAVALLRWLRVAQREHYLAGSATKFARRWWCSTNANVALISVGAFAAVIAFMWPVAGLLPATVAVLAPLGLR